MKILFFVGEFPKLSQTFILNQMTGFIDAGHDVVILAKKGESGRKVHEDVVKYHLMDKVIYYGDRRQNSKIAKGAGFLSGLVRHAAGRLFKEGYTGRASIKDLIKYPNLILLIRKLNQVDLTDVDIIHAHFGPNGILAQKCIELGLLKGRLFTTFHGYDMLRYVKQKGENVYRELFRSDCTLLPISRFWGRRCLELGAVPEKLIVHHMGIDVDKFEYCPAPDSRVIQIVTAARFVEKKGLEYGIRAVGRLIREGAPVRYLIVGGGPLEYKLRRIISELGLSDQIRLPGWKTQDELIDIMRETHIILAPSVTGSDGDMEGIPVQLMEAMAMGKIVISTRHSGIPELIHHRINGFLVDEKDIDGLRQMISEVISSRSIWGTISENARQTVIDEFNIKSLNTRLLKLFDQTRMHQR
ncbi:colanic acid biosynthesis glycosyltransferase WcaL [Sporolactobacillus sp. THM7-4]|nr:colanic acid biosynthesis glycosyltransferase WcaL [Sporolactobacillus sp. THM7-4]